jgi:hypothetical protein
VAWLAVIFIHIIVDSQLHSCQAKDAMWLHGSERNKPCTKLKPAIENVQVALLLCEEKQHAWANNQGFVNWPGAKQQLRSKHTHGMRHPRSVDQNS